ncbi:MAG: Gfo/Idh/MocA family oxidoreductase [Armatimonadetes bacterium]|nr:Gfo/Idh/MocA family oxidoreductase [Armatimonadota bacterium]
MRGIVVGLGGRARSWVTVCQRNPNVELVGFVEPVEDNRRAAQEQFALADSLLYTTLADALQSVSADFVVDVTPPAVHETIATAAFQAGLHVIQEKPLSDEWEPARRTVAAADRHGRRYMITQNYRFGAVPRSTRPLIEAGRIGRPEQGSMGFYRAWATRAGTHYTTMAFPLIKDMGIHHFDLLRYVLGQEPVAVQTVTWNPSWGWHAGDASHNVHIQFDGGCRITHHAGGSSVGRQSPWNGDLRLEGSGGSLTWEEDRIVLTRAKPGEPVERDEVPAQEVPPGQDACLAEFLTAIREDREPECSGRDNLQSLAIVFAAVRSAQDGRVVQIEELFQ